MTPSGVREIHAGINMYAKRNATRLGRFVHNRVAAGQQRALQNANFC